MTQVAKKILVTCALPYANGSIHLGHMLEHIQADVWVRYQRMRGHEVNFICADDAHGTPIMLKAQQLGITPEQMIGEMSQEHQTDFAGFNISYDNYHSTHSEENRQLSELIYSRLKENGFIKNRTISQLYDPEKGMFLPDRFVKGTCPKCKSPDQYGDNCEVCGATYSPTELIDAKKGIVMFEKVEVPVLGIVENMSVHICSNCGHHEPIFGTGGAEKLAEKYHTQLLGQMPLHISLREDLDKGTPTVISRPESEFTAIYRQLADRVAAQLYWQGEVIPGEISFRAV